MNYFSDIFYVRSSVLPLLHPDQPHVLPRDHMFPFPVCCVSSAGDMLMWWADSGWYPPHSPASGGSPRWLAGSWLLHRKQIHPGLWERKQNDSCWGCFVWRCCAEQHHYESQETRSKTPPVHIQHCSVKTTQLQHTYNTTLHLVFSSSIRGWTGFSSKLSEWNWILNSEQVSLWII